MEAKKKGWERVYYLWRIKKNNGNPNKCRSSSYQNYAPAVINSVSNKTASPAKETLFTPAYPSPRSSEGAEKRKS